MISTLEAAERLLVFLRLSVLTARTALLDGPALVVAVSHPVGLHRAPVTLEVVLQQGVVRVSVIPAAAKVLVALLVVAAVAAVLVLVAVVGLLAAVARRLVLAVPAVAVVAAVGLVAVVLTTAAAVSAVVVMVPTASVVPVPLRAAVTSIAPPKRALREILVLDALKEKNVVNVKNADWADLLSLVESYTNAVRNRVVLVIALVMNAEDANPATKMALALKTIVGA